MKDQVREKITAHCTNDEDALWKRFEELGIDESGYQLEGQEEIWEAVITSFEKDNEFPMLEKVEDALKAGNREKENILERRVLRARRKQKRRGTDSLDG